MAERGDVNFINSEGWTELFWLNSGGTREKKILMENDGQKWFFKCSEKKEAQNSQPEKYYRYEFWSEVLAYQLGRIWGLEVLRYDPAISEGQIGCISKSMLEDDKEQLIEVGRYMVAINSDFNPTLYKTRNHYTFQLLMDTLKVFGLDKYRDLFFQTIIFDAVIGNTDRHQENWAFIARNSIVNKSLKLTFKELGFLKNFWFYKKIFARYVERFFRKEGAQMDLYFKNIRRLAPIYDNGSSMVRELNDQRVNELMSDDAALEKYIENGKAEIHWQGKKLSHFGLVTELVNSSYIQDVRAAGSFLSKVDKESVKEIVNNIDSSVPDTWAQYKIPQPRKDLICKVLISRTEKLKKLL